MRVSEKMCWLVHISHLEFMLIHWYGVATGTTEYAMRAGSLCRCQISAVYAAKGHCSLSKILVMWTAVLTAVYVFTALTHPSYLRFHSEMLLRVSISFEVTNSNLLLTVWPLCYKEVYILGSELPFLLFNFHYSILGMILIHLNSYVRHAYTAKKDLLFDKCISHQNCNCWHGLWDDTY